MATTVWDVLRHLVLYGPARNPAEAEELTAAIEAAEHAETQPDTATDEERFQ